MATEPSYAFSQTVVVVVSVQPGQTHPEQYVAQVQDARGKVYPLIPVGRVWGSGAHPQAGEYWNLIKDNGAWTFKSRAGAPVDSNVISQIVAAVGTTPHPGVDLLQAAWTQEISPDSSGRATLSFPPGVKYSLGYVADVRCLTPSSVQVVFVPGASTLGSVVTQMYVTSTGATPVAPCPSVLVGATVLGA